MTAVLDATVTTPYNPATILDTPDGFMAWLGDFRPGDEVGITNLASECPIARYLSSIFGGEIAVWTYGYSIDGTKYISATWHTDFVRNVDYVLGAGGDEENSYEEFLSVTSAQALAALALCA
jgi:hypothetical protein